MVIPSILLHHQMDRGLYGEHPAFRSSIAHLLRALQEAGQEQTVATLAILVAEHAVFASAKIPDPLSVSGVQAAPSTWRVP